ncbi:MAG: SusD/RagB family nutrient-binding outer membrane lipoprotein [Saprospiraceae bacterium]|nr:SusD/RagB family nutrient-binding outer membrane lipoprotein [Saprospiraceae bacterium]MDW8485234.1 SusD/RagB family nutrient-binding outer membrane lipoprotein [Saprospiraceae bacterium]
MKVAYKILLVLLLLVSISACEQTELNLQENPNAVSPEKADANFLLNSVLLKFNTFHIGLWGPTSAITRMRAMTSNTYQSQLTPPSFNGIWYDAYAALLPDINALIPLAESRGLAIHAAIAKILKAMTAMTLVDLFGDVPYEEAVQGAGALSPRPESGASIYNKALALLDEAINQLNGTKAVRPTSDFFYSGNPDRWIDLANTLKMRAFLQTRLVDNQAGAKFKAIVDGGKFINSIAKDFQFPYGNNRVNPNSRHPFYNDSYENLDGTYQSNWYMWQMAEAKGIRDPRIRFYFYRQREQYDLTDRTLYSCIHSLVPDSNARPPFYRNVDPRMPYCVATYDGYYGRDHGNGQGIPPDGPIRTVYGLYPAGGRFDDNSFEQTRGQGTQGARGEGINPIMLATFVDFMRAEAALTMGTGENARALLESGIRKSFEKVLSFVPKGNFTRQIGVDANGNPITAEVFIPKPADITNYVNHILARYDAAPDDRARLDIIVKEYLIALWGNALEAYNTMRRTCLPTQLQPNINGIKEPFPRSFLYPSDHINRNSNAQQKPDLNQPVFWDKNGASCLE